MSQSSEKKKTVFLRSVKDLKSFVESSDAVSHTSSKSMTAKELKKYQSEQKRKADVFSPQITLSQNRLIGTPNSDNNSNTLFRSSTTTLKQSSFIPARIVSTGYSAWKENVKLNDEKNFLPRNNNFNSTELLQCSGILKVGFTDVDSTKASLLYDQNYSFNEPPLVLNSLEQRSLFTQIHGHYENKVWRDEESERLKNPVYGFVPPPPMPIRNAQEIVEDSLDYLMKLRMQKPVVEKPLVFNPYEITSQIELEKLIEKDRIKNKGNEIYQKKNERELRMKNANDIMSFLGMEEEKLLLKKQEEKIIEEENEEEKQKKKKQIKEQEKMTEEKKVEQRTISQIIQGMSDLTPDQQKLDNLNSARGANARDAKSNFREGDKEINKRKVNLISEGIKKQLEIERKLEEEAAAKATLAALYGPPAEEEKTNVSEKEKIDKGLTQKVLKDSFIFPRRYSSTIIETALKKQGKFRFISKYVSQSIFNVLDGQEEDEETTVLQSANYGQKVLLIEQTPPEIKGIMIPHGKFRHPFFVEEDATEEEILLAKFITTKPLKEIESK